MSKNVAELSESGFARFKDLPDYKNPVNLLILQILIQTRLDRIITF
jgi:hypothetical protein